MVISSIPDTYVGQNYYGIKHYSIIFGKMAVSFYTVTHYITSLIKQRD